jgi:3-deoxy-D-manno-octulosonic-acid transferase
MSIWSDMIYGAAGLISSPVWGYRLWRTGKWRTDWAGRLGRCDVKPAPGRRTLLIHAVSVGEVNAAKPLIDRLHARCGDRIRLVVSTTTDTGTQRARELFGCRHDVVRYPLDFTAAVRRFLSAVRPDAVVLMELEVWPTFVSECAARGVPVMVANGRLSERSYSRYRWILPLIRRSFASLAAAGVQDEAYARRFIGLGAAAERVTVAGNMKWDANLTAGADEALRQGAARMATAMGIDRDSPLIVCGSTGPGEEKLMAEALAGLSRGGYAAQLMMVPRKPERFDEAAAAMGPQVVRRSGCPDGTERRTGSTRFLLDTIGELRQAYWLADVAVVGRSFCPLFGSNMLEPIVLGKPTVVGPNTADFREMMEKLLAGGGIEQVDDAAGLTAAVGRLLDPVEGRALAERGMAVVRRQQGAVERHAAMIERVLESPSGAGREL